MLRLALALPALLALQVAATPPTDHYELGMFRSGQLTTPYSLTQYPLDRVSCGHIKSEEAPDGVPNPTVLTFIDPADDTKECRLDVRTAVISLPLGTGYKAALRSVASDGTVSTWGYIPFTFRRAPRGLPCLGGLPGVLIQGEADLNGNVVTMAICVQH